jgi:hypothetical protein
MEEMARSYIGIFKIGDKATGSITHVQVVEELTSACWPMKVVDYVGRGFLPRHDDLPWWQDWSSRPAAARRWIATLPTIGRKPV